MASNNTQASEAVTQAPAGAEDERLIARFLYDEAEMMDNMQWEDWLDCMHDDVDYLSLIHI